MSNICDRCGKPKDKLIPLDDASRSAELSAQYSELLDVPYPYECREYVCIKCVREILNITDEDIVREERATIDTHFQINLLKGQLSQVIIESIFRKFGYEVYPYGYESYLTNIIKFLRKPHPNIPVRKLRATPDIFVYDRELNDGYFLEIKATNTPDESSYWISKYTLDTYNTYWPEAILVIYCLKSMNIYCRRIKDVSFDQLPTEQSPFNNRVNYIIDLQTEFLALPDSFRLLEPTLYQEYLQMIREVIDDYHTPNY